MFAHWQPCWCMSVVLVTDGVVVLVVVVLVGGGAQPPPLVLAGQASAQLTKAPQALPLHLSADFAIVHVIFVPFLFFLSHTTAPCRPQVENLAPIVAAFLHCLFSDEFLI